MHRSARSSTDDSEALGAINRGRLAARVFDVLRVIDEGADSTRDSYPTGLRWLHGHLGRTGKDTTEDAISEAIAERVPGEGGIIAARTQVPYPPRLRALGDGVTRGTCDLVLELADGVEAWIEVKGAWPYLRSGSRLTANSSYRHHLVGMAKGAARDFAKLAPMTLDEAALIGVLVIGFDIDEPGTRWEITDADLSELERNAGDAGAEWARRDRWWRDPHASRVYGDARSEQCRTRCFFWMRGSVRQPLERLAGMLRRRNVLDAEIAALIGRPAEKGHLGEFIAAEVFDIELDESAVNAGSDGVFRSGALAGQTVNVKLYGAQEGMLDVSKAPPPDFYVVLTGPKRSASSSRGMTRPLVIEHAFVFGHEDLLAAGVRPGTAASVRQHLWRAAQVFPTPGDEALIRLTDEQRSALAQFSAAAGASQGR